MGKVTNKVETIARTLCLINLERAAELYYTNNDELLELVDLRWPEYLSEAEEFNQAMLLVNSCCTLDGYIFDN